jgi:hypothetical protein
MMSVRRRIRAFSFAMLYHFRMHTDLRLRICLLTCALVLATGCQAPRERLSFPAAPIQTLPGKVWYDVNHDGKPDFALSTTPDGRVDQLCYDDNEDGTIDRSYRLDDYADDKVPHLILLMDSIPFQTMADRYNAGDFRWFDPPQKMIAPFPSLTEICFTDILGAPPMEGVVDECYDPRTGDRHHKMWNRIMGYRDPWERRLDYELDYPSMGLSFLDPNPWFGAELINAKREVDRSPNRVTICYIGSAASMVCKYGKAGAEKVLDGVRQLSLQLLYERCGAIKISVMADHGHNYQVSKNLPIAQWVHDAGYHVTDKIRGNQDAVLELFGLVTISGVHTNTPEPLAIALSAHKEIELTMYLRQDDAIIRNAAGSAAIQCRDGKLRYLPIDGDPLGYAPLIDALKGKGLLDADGYGSDDVWFNQTLDHEYPNAPRRVWAALHGKLVTVPSLLFTTRDGFCAGNPDFEKYITMASSHGGLNQVNSATFVISMTHRLNAAVRHEDVINTLEPGFHPRLVR